MIVTTSVLPFCRRLGLGDRLERHSSAAHHGGADGQNLFPQMASGPGHVAERESQLRGDRQMVHRMEVHDARGADGESNHKR